MPRTPKGHKRPADAIGNAVHVMKIATGEIEELPTGRIKNAAAEELGRMGGEARAKALSSGKKRAIASNAAKARWAKTHTRRRGRDK